MPKCELKPWVIDMPQMVWIDVNGDECVSVIFCKRNGKVVRHVSIEHLEPQEDGLYWYDYCTDEGMEERWRQAFVDLLGIPETIGDGEQC